MGRARIWGSHSSPGPPPTTLPASRGMEANGDPQTREAVMGAGGWAGFATFTLGLGLIVA